MCIVEIHQPQNQHADWAARHRAASSRRAPVLQFLVADGGSRTYYKGMSAPSREQFVDQILKVVPDRFPLVKLARGEEPFSMRVNGHIVSLENLYRLAVLQPGQSQRHIERWIIELLRASEGTPDRDSTFEELKDRIYPMILPENASEAYSFSIAQPLVCGLNIAYGIDSDHTIAYILKSQFEKWNMSIDDLHGVAIENLVRRSEAMPATAAQDEDGQISRILFQTGDGYDSSRVLLPTLHERLREYLGSPFAAAIPTRNLLICFRADAQNVQDVKTQVIDDFRKMPHQVTDQILLITADGIAPLVG